MSDHEHRRPPGATDAEVAAAGKMSEALEWVERARGHLYSLHQLMGRADYLFGDAAQLLREAGHDDLADRVDTEVVGRNVLAGRWTFQIVEEFDDGYYGSTRSAETEVRNRLLAGRRHVYEAELKDRRRTPGRPGHEELPPEELAEGAIGTARCSDHPRC